MAATTVRRDLLSGLVMKQETDEKRTVAEMASHAQVLMYIYSAFSPNHQRLLADCILVLLDQRPPLVYFPG